MSVSMTGYDLLITAFGFRRCRAFGTGQISAAIVAVDF
jgi:hypothetical protein